MTQDTLVQRLSGGFGQGVEPEIDKNNVVVRIGPDKVTALTRFIRDQLGFDMLTSLTAVDNVTSFELIYHFTSVKPVTPTATQPAFPGYLQVRVEVPRDYQVAPDTGPDPEPVVPSVTPLYPGANQQEREIYDLMGIRFKGHPRLERILLWEGFPGHPLRKDWRPLNAEIPWHLAGLKGFGGELMESPDPTARVADDGSGISQPVPVGTTPQAANRPPSRAPKPTETMRIKIGQGGIVDDEGPRGPRSGYGASPELSAPEEKA